MIFMQKRVLGILLTVLGFGGMMLAGYLFVTGSGGRGLLLEVTGYMIAGASCFFAGLNYIYDSANTFQHDSVPAEEFEDVSPIQQQWRTIHVAGRQVAGSKTATAKQASAQRTASGQRAAAPVA